MGLVTAATSAAILSTVVLDMDNGVVYPPDNANPNTWSTAALGVGDYLARAEVIRRR
jgi:hypothetical protein